MNKEVKEIREYISCPQFGDDHYGEWGTLTLKQRIKIKQLYDYITNLQEENKKLQERYNALLEAHKIVDELEITNQSKIDKAIEELKQAHINIENNNNTNYIHVAFRDDLLNILQGENENE